MTPDAKWLNGHVAQIAFIRISSNPKIIADAVTPREALEVLKKIVAVPGHHFWPDTVAPADAKPLRSAAFVATFDGGSAELIQATKERHQHVTVIEA